MLQLKDIRKDYTTGDETVHALKGISIAFRTCEFVSVLGQSGCGKTTLLNLIGGLDQYTSGDLVINGRSTKEFRDRDWDTYRNHAVGFVFQSYHLIPHQSVLTNVELALTLSGVSPGERRRRAAAALERVGLGDQLRKRPNQLSGGQMQRVAIARALVNDPDIILADEPTGALDSDTSVQIMELLKEVASDRLVIMVTHNPELAERYSTRIVRLLDGTLISDSMPYDPEEEERETRHDMLATRTSMSFLTAFRLSMNNLLTKKGRTLLTGFAGSIGIIGIALILSLSSGMQDYIDRMEEDTLTSYPITIEQASMDMGALVGAMSEISEAEHEAGQIYSANVMTDMMNSMFRGITTNDLGAFKKELETEGNEIAALSSEIQYSYDTQINIYSVTGDGWVRTNPSGVLSELGLGALADGNGMMSFGGQSGMSVCREIVDSDDMMESDYELLTGSWPHESNEVIVLVSSEYIISDYALYAMGLLDLEQLKEEFRSAQAEIVEGGTLEREYAIDNSDVSFSYEELLGLDLRLVLPSDLYQEQEDGTFLNMEDDESFVASVLEDAEPLHVVGIAAARDSNTTESGSIGYRSSLTLRVMEETEESAVVKAQKADPDTDIFTGLPFRSEDNEEETAETGETSESAQSLSSEQTAMLEAILEQMPEEYAGALSGMTPEEQVQTLVEYGVLDETEFQALAAEENSGPKYSKSTYEENLAALYNVSSDEPSGISIYASSFENKEEITDALDRYNEEKKAEGKDELAINYTDYVGLLMSSVTRIVNIVSYVLIAFVSISLIVSSIMIGVITLISVQERTKEIGILRAMGASKRDISRVFRAETLIIGLVAGLIGIGITILLNIPINAVIHALTDISGLSRLPVAGGVALVLISVGLTVLSGLIPSRSAARKDPVEALRTE